MPQGRADTLWYLAPGIVHQLGNALFTLHGRARLLAGAEPGRIADDVRAMLDGVERANTGLNVLRWLCEEGRPAAVPIAQVAQAFVDVARVPLRDRGLTLELAEVPREPAPVEPGAICRLLTAGCRAVVANLPGQPGGRLALSCTAVGTEIRFSFGLQAAGVPLPLDQGHAADAIRADLAQAQARAEAGADGEVLVLFAPMARGATFRPS